MLTRRFVIFGSKAKASPDFLLNDIPSTSGRLDVLLRCLRAALLVSHGVRRDTLAYLVLEGDPERVVTLRVDGSAAKYLRPDDRSLATLIRKALSEPLPLEGEPGFHVRKPGVALARGGLEAVLPELAGSALHLLDEAGRDCRDSPELAGSAQQPVTFFLGDHTGFSSATRARLDALAPRALSVGPLSLHGEDAIALAHNELDRALAGRVG